MRELREDRTAPAPVALDIPRLSPTAAIFVVTFHGMVDGGELETQHIALTTFDGHTIQSMRAHDGTQPLSLEMYDLEDFHIARSLYEQLSK